MTVIMLACKMFDDFVCVNSFYAAVGGIELAEMN